MQCDFKTSYVTVYRISNEDGSIAVKKFQNIVCYCLSMGPGYTEDACRNFKTSYVTVYHTRLQDHMF